MKYLFIAFIVFALTSCNADEEAKKNTLKPSAEIKEVEKEAISYYNFNASIDIVDTKLITELEALGYDSLESDLAIIQEERSNNTRILHLNGIRKSMIQLEFFTRNKILNLMTICNLMLQESSPGNWMKEDIEKGIISFELAAFPKSDNKQLAANYMKENEMLFRSEISNLRRQMTTFCIPKDTITLNAINTVFRNEETDEELDQLINQSLSVLESEAQKAIVKRIIATLAIPNKVKVGSTSEDWINYQFKGMTAKNASTYFTSLKTDIELLKGEVMDYLVSNL